MSSITATRINTGLDEEALKGVPEILNRLLADEYVLYTKTRNYHWNVVGIQFNDLHKFFEGQYEELNEIVDDVAERARSLDAWADGTLQEFSANTRLAEHPAEHPEARAMIARLLEDHETLVRTLRVDLDICVDRYHDIGTNDFLTGLMEKHEKMAWMLRSFLEAR